MTVLDQTLDSNVPVVNSQESGYAPFETIWDDSQLEAIPSYNYWTSDEATNSSGDRGNRELVDLPRYIKLTWNPAPDLVDLAAFRKRATSNRFVDTRSEFTQLSPFGFGSYHVTGTLANGILFTPAHLQPGAFEENVGKVANGYISSGIVEVVVQGGRIPPSYVVSMPVDEDQYLADHETWAGLSYPEFIASVFRRLAGSMLGTSNVTAGVRPAVTTLDTALRDARPLPATSSMTSVRTNLIHTDLSGLITEERVRTVTSPDQADSILAVSMNAADLTRRATTTTQTVTRNFNIPSDPAPDTLKPLEYIGYVIEKWELINGSYALVDKFYVPGREYTDYYDADVKYGASYRYRMRAILRWSRNRNLGVMGTDPTVSGDVSGMNALTPNLVSYFHGEWNRRWAYVTLVDMMPPPPPDEFRVRPISNYTMPSGEHSGSVVPCVEISFKFPYNPQRDINRMAVFRKVQDEHGIDITEWKQVFSVNVDTRFLDAPGEGRDEMWAGYAECGPANGIFWDTSVEYWGSASKHRYVYSGVSYTKHGEASALSDQLGVRLNPNWKKQGEFLVNFISCAGVDKDFDSGAFATFPEKRATSEFLVDPGQLVALKGQARTAPRQLPNSDYVMRVESLDTGESVDVPVKVTVKNI